MSSLPLPREILESERDVLLVGMSGVGKSWIAEKMLQLGGWRRRSIDTEIQNKYLQKAIKRVVKTELLQSPMLGTLHNMGQLQLADDPDGEHLSYLTGYLGMVGDPYLGGLYLNEFQWRQKCHKKAELSALAAVINDKAESNERLVVDTSGSLCEVVDLTSDEQSLMSQLSERFLIVSLREDDAMVDLLKDRYKKHPKPIYYPEDQLRELINTYERHENRGRDGMNPLAFATWAYDRLVATRRQKYALIAEQWGISIEARTFYE